LPGGAIALEFAHIRNTVIPVTTITFKVSEDEALRIRQRAKQAHLSVSEYLRRRAAGTDESAPLAKVRCEITGAEIFGPINGSPPLTTESVRQMLAEFP
jgi:hypothetical protein